MEKSRTGTGWGIMLICGTVLQWMGTLKSGFKLDQYRRYCTLCHIKLYIAENRR